MSYKALGKSIGQVFGAEATQRTQSAAKVTPFDPAAKPRTKASFGSDTFEDSVPEPQPAHHNVYKGMKTTAGRHVPYACARHPSCT